MHFCASSVTAIFGNQKKWLDFAGKLSGSHFFFFWGGGGGWGASIWPIFVRG